MSSAIQLNLAATASQARVLRFPRNTEHGTPANPLAHLPETVAELRAEIRSLTAQLEALQTAAERRAQREQRLAEKTIMEIDGLDAFRAKLGLRRRHLRISVTSKLTAIYE